MNNTSIKSVVATGIGAALFIVVGMISIPTPVPNTSIQLQYAVQALFAVIFGPLPGFFIGLIGHALKDIIQSGAIWWTWVIPSAIFGLLIGLIGNRLGVKKGTFSFKDILIFNAVQIAANILVWVAVAPYGDILVYKEAAAKVFVQGWVAAGTNILTVAIAGTVLLWAYAKSQAQSGSLSKE